MAAFLFQGLRNSSGAKVYKFSVAHSPNVLSYMVPHFLSSFLVFLLNLKNILQKNFKNVGMECSSLCFSRPKLEFLQLCPLKSAQDRLGYTKHIGIARFCDKLRNPLSKTYKPNVLSIRCDNVQNADFAKHYSKKEKKPFPIPIVELRRAARERAKNRNGQPRRPCPPSRVGMLAKNLIPVAYNVYNARVTLINNLQKLLKVVPVQACKWCNEIHVGPVGHPFKSCRGQGSPLRKGIHEWGSSVVEDIIVPIEAYHLYDRLGKRITHNERYSIPRIPAVVELCIQAGLDLPEYPTKRRRKPIIRIGKNEFIDADESELPDPSPEERPKVELLTEITNEEVKPPSCSEEKVQIANETLSAWEVMRQGSLRLMKMYPVRVCGYCPEIHVGPNGHKAQNCGATKHQQRNGQHGWQASVLDDLVPPRYVWHVPDLDKPEMRRELRNFYGQAPAVVEICIQAGVDIPEQYKPTMRLDVGIPSDVREAEMVV